jgi:hypothetical protein
MAIVAVPFASLAPAISHVLRVGSPSGWTEICTALGSRLVPADAGEPAGQSPASSGEHLFEHCPYGSLHVPALGMPEAPLAFDALVAPSSGVPERFLTAPRTLFAWATAQPRGPPLHS